MQQIKKRLKSNDEAPENKNIIKENATDSGQESIRSRNISLKLFSRTIFITSLLIVVYFSSSKDDKMKIFARQTDFLTGKGLILECSLNFLKDIDKYEGCFPKECKRFVTDKVISLEETDELLSLVHKELQRHSFDEGITNLDLVSGTLSNGQHNTNIYDDKESAYLLYDLNIIQVVKEKVKYAIVHHFGVEPSKIFLTRPVLLTEIKPYSSKNVRTSPNEYWHPRVDNDVEKSCHFTALLYLGDYNKDFKGGRFIFVDENVNKTVEPRKSRLSMFTSGGENRYYVEKVTSGIRYTVTFFFSCDEKYAIENLKIEKNTN